MVVTRNRINNAIRIVKEDGYLRLLIKSLQLLQARANRGKESPRPNKLEFLPVVRQKDILLALERKRPIQEKTSVNKERLMINWIMPPPGKGSGGHTTLFRFIQKFEQRGHVNRIYFYSKHNNGSVKAARDILDKYFPPTHSELHWFNDISDISTSDVMFATSWETAYVSFASNSDAKRFYFVQDFEPFFYPVGGMYALAENTYRFGFYGITAGKWLSKKLKNNFGMQSKSFNLGVNSKEYKYLNTNTRKEISCYVRPHTDRRGFEIAMLTLALFNKKHPSCTINLYGADVSFYKLPFKYKNLGILTTVELNSLHNRCAASLVISCTNMSLLPLELLSAGTIPVVNSGDNNELVCDNPYIKYAPCTPTDLANKLSEVICTKDLPKVAKEASMSVVSDDWDSSTSSIVEHIEKLMLIK